MATDPPQQTVSNLILSSLREHDFVIVMAQARRVTFVLQQVLHEPGSLIQDVYFIDQGLISLTADTGDNGLVEVGMAGTEGFAGTTLMLNPRAVSSHRALVQVPGSAFRINAHAFRALLDQLPAFRAACHLYLEFFVKQTSQAAACNARHELPERLARWLLMTIDRHTGDEMPMTQEFLSYMLGVRRAGVSVVASSLQSRGLIQQSRGRIRVLDREGLEREACSCYAMIRRWQHDMAESVDQSSLPNLTEHRDIAAD